MVAVPRDPRWGRTFEAYGRDPELVADLGAALVLGLQGAGPHIDVLACAKHYVGDGATAWGSTSGAAWVDWWARAYSQPGWRLDQGDTRIDEATLRSEDLPPYLAAIAQGVGSIMASYSSWNGTKVHANRWLLADLLKGELGFEGLVVTDFMAVDQVCPDYREAVVRCLEAGIDMVMVPFGHARFRAETRAAVEAGELSLERLDDAVGRILRVKEAMGLLDAQDVTLPEPAVLGCGEHRALARRAAAAGAVLLSDDAAVLPIRDDATVLVVGAAAGDIGLACGGWTIEWAGGEGPVTTGSTLVDGLREHLGDRVVGTGATADDLAPLEGVTAGIGVVAVHEPPYAEGLGDRERLGLAPEQMRLVRAVAAVTDRVVVVVYSGRHVVLGDVAEHADAIVAAWWPGSEAAGLADVLVGTRPFTGRLPVDWPGKDLDPPEGDWAGQRPRWPRGHGAATAAGRAGAERE
jgi:beta-glucosidase